jgi:hypothetical protein
MDPTQAVTEIRAKIAEILEQSEAGSVFLEDLAGDQVNEHALALADLAGEIAELFAGLDSWLAGGGFTPEQWSRGSRRPSVLEGLAGEARA